MCCTSGSSGMLLPSRRRGNHPRTSRKELFPGHGLDSAFKLSTWEMRRNCCSSCPSAPRGGTQRNLCLSPSPPHGSQGSVQPRLSPQAHPYHSNEELPQKGGPCPEQRAAWDGGGGRGSVVSTDECKCLHPPGATSLGTTQRGFVSGRLREASLIRKPPGMPSKPQLEKRLGAHTDLPHHP